MLRFKYELKLKDTEKVFREGLGPGVLVQVEVFIKDATDVDIGNVMLAKSLAETKSKLIEEHIEVVITPIEANEEEKS